jgi:hypothetical protein
MASMETADEKKTFWQRLGEAHDHRFPDHGKQMTQKDAGVLIGGPWPQSTAKKWKNGGLPTMENAVALAEKLDVCVEWLLTGRGPKHPLSKIEVSTVEWLRKLDDDLQRKEALGMLKANVLMTPPDPQQAGKRARSTSSRSTSY